MTTDDQLLNDRRRIWHDFSRLLFWGPIHIAVFLIVAIMLAVHGPTVGTVLLSLILIGVNVAVTAGYFMSRRW